MKRQFKYAFLSLFGLIFVGGINTAQGKYADSANYSLSETAFDHIESGKNYVITATYNNIEYALKSCKFSGGNSTATDSSTLDSSNISDYLWNFTIEDDNLEKVVISTSDGFILRHNNSNNGVSSVDTTKYYFTLSVGSDSSYCYLSNNSRYLSLYKNASPDWRCYENTTAGIADLKLYLYDNSYLSEFINSNTNSHLMVDYNASSSTTFSKVTDESTCDDWSGTYMLGFEDINGNTKFWNGKDNANCFCFTQKLTGDNLFLSSNDCALILVEKNTGALTYSFKLLNGDYAGKYIGNATKTNGISFNTNKIDNSFEYDSELLIKSGTSTLRFYDTTSGQRFRFYQSFDTSSYKSVSLYKESTTKINTYIPTTTSIDSTTRYNVSLQFGSCIEKSLYDGINNQFSTASSIDYGVRLEYTSISGSFKDKRIDCTPVAVNEYFASTGCSISEATHYQFLVSLDGIDFKNFNTIVTASSYIKVTKDDLIYYYDMKSANFSVNSISKYYIDNLSEDEYVKQYLDVLNFWSKFGEEYE